MQKQIEVCKYKFRYKKHMKNKDTKMKFKMTIEYNTELQMKSILRFRERAAARVHIAIEHFFELEHISETSQEM